jgi:hypothetical protein
VASAPSVPGITPSALSVPGQPFGTAVLPGGRYAVVAVRGAAAADVEVLALGGGTPQLVRTVPLPGPAGAGGLAVSHDGQYLAVTQNTVTTVVSLPELLAGNDSPVLGVTSPSDVTAGWAPGWEGELSSPQAMLARILDVVPQPVWVVDHLGCVMFAHPAARPVRC